jgi:IS30 family transposase
VVVSEWRRIRDERQARFWLLVRAGSTFSQACEAVGVDPRQGYRWRRMSAGRPPSTPRVVSSRFLSVEERLQIADLRLSGVSMRAIGSRLGRAPSTISRELRRNGPTPAPVTARPNRARYDPYAAHKRAGQRARRPKPFKLDCARLASAVQAGLCQNWSPQQISGHLRDAHGDEAAMQVSHETIYQALFVQGRGQLRAELHVHLRTGRAWRRTRGQSGANKSKIPGMVSISERPAEADDRAVPGHWEGDLILGSNCRSAIGTLVERQTRYCLLVHLPDGHGAETVRDRLVLAIKTLPTHLRRSLTWDQGTELAQHHAITLATDMSIYFCDPHSPWQRGSNENTNGLLRQYFPKGTDLSVHSPARLLEVATELNARPRKTLGRITPAQAMQRLLSDHPGESTCLCTPSTTSMPSQAS